MATNEDARTRNAINILIQVTAWMTPISIILGSVANALVIIRTFGAG